jgi:hypothetical protein
VGTSVILNGSPRNILSFAFQLAPEFTLSAIHLGDSLTWACSQHTRSPPTGHLVRQKFFALAHQLRDNPGRCVSVGGRLFVAPDLSYIPTEHHIRPSSTSA